MTYRDDRDALLARLEALETELASARAEDVTALRAELTALREKVGAATQELDHDRAALGEVTRGLDALLARTAQASQPARPLAAKRQPNPAMIIVAGFLVMAICAGAMYFALLK